ncbi:hypothetical protein [Noviherbaspirillum saxi]|uniref:Uncharacterized protein n=1 Tax=Noviherbaspirillum saxi TaxID=2320863 RepID=A0A3A3FWI6_9BURK|nr:hypothetical protein [Noviherbaspirillum saxi]RJF98988.1 hypothetical protein D3871_11050 [Noviherbaspirillum saxi]
MEQWVERIHNSVVFPRRSFMQIETIGKYQIHLLAHEVAGGKQWDPFITILKFDDLAGDFRCVLEKRRAADTPLDTYEQAIEVARQIGTMMLKKGEV